MTTSIVTKKHQRSHDVLKGIVKHNRIKSMDFGNTNNDEDDGLDMSNASITEALLD